MLSNVICPYVYNNIINNTDKLSDLPGETSPDLPALLVDDIVQVGFSLFERAENCRCNNYATASLIF